MLRLTLALGALVAALPAQANDVSAQQVGVEYARENMERAEAEHKGNLQRVADSEQRLSDAQKRLLEDQQRAAASKKSLEDSKAKHARAMELLDQAWKRP